MVRDRYQKGRTAAAERKVSAAKAEAKPAKFGISRLHVPSGGFKIAKVRREVSLAMGVIANEYPGEGEEISVEGDPQRATLVYRDVDGGKTFRVGNQLMPKAAAIQAVAEFFMVAYKRARKAGYPGHMLSQSVE
jgi:hypothetical protein